MRFLVLIGGATAGVLVLCAVLLMVLVDPNKYKGEITRLVQERYHRELVFEGDVRLAYLPRLGVQTGAVRLGNAPGFGEEPFARVEGASVSVRLLPLLTGKVEVGRIVLDGLAVNLAKSEQGVTNWADLTGPEAPQNLPPEAEAEIQKAVQRAVSSTVSGLRLDGVRLENASLTWENRVLDEGFSLSALSAEIKAIRPGQPVDFEAAFQFDNPRKELRAQEELRGTATLNVGEDRHILSNLALKLSAAGKPVPGGKGDFAFGLAELKVDLKQQTATGTGLTIGAYGAKGTGQFVATNLAGGATGGPDFKGRLDFPDFNGRELSAALTGKAPDTADASAYQHITASLEFRAGRGYLEIPTLTASLDDARVEGRFRATGLNKKAYSFNLRISGLDADRFLPAQKEGAAKSEQAAQAQAGADGAGGAAPKEELFPMKALREMKLDGQITAERLKVKGLRFASLKVPVMLQDGLLDLGQVEARLYDGSLKGALRVDVQGDRPALTLNFQLVGVQQKPLFSDFTGRESQYSGVMSIDTVSPLVCQGNTLPALKRSLSGRARISVRDGVFPGINMVGVAQNPGRKGKSDQPVAEPGAHTGSDKSTKFGSIDCTAGIVSGVATVADLDFKAPYLRADGKGTLDIATKHTEFTVLLRVVPSAEGQGGSTSVPGLPVPLRITGPYDNLSFSNDYLRTIGRTALDAVTGVVQGIGNVLTGKKQPSHQGGTPENKSGGVLNDIKKLF